MPETVNGYELFQLPCSNSSEEKINYAVYRNPVGPDGYRSQVLYGARTGLRRFSIPYDGTLRGGTANADITFEGVTMSRAKYIRSVFRRSKVSGEPFVIKSSENDQYYLAEFAETEQSLQRKLAAVYSTTVELVQVRKAGATVFDPTRMSGLWGYFDAETSFAGLGLVDDQPLNDMDWPDLSGDAHHLTFTNLGSKYQLNEQNGLPIVQLSPSTSTTYLRTLLSPVIYEALFVMKMREATFSNFGGILTADSGVAMLVGNSGTTKFYDHGFTVPFFYEKNSVEYTAANQQAPMNEYGVVRARMSGGMGLTNMQIGKDRAATDRYAEIDIAAIALFDALQPEDDVWELVEYLEDRWDIGS